MTVYEERRLKSKKCKICGKEILDNSQKCIIKIPNGKITQYETCHKTCINELFKLFNLIREEV